LPTSARSGKKIGMLPVTFGAKWLVVKILSILNLILNITSGQVFHTLEISILGFRIGRWGMWVYPHPIPPLLAQVWQIFRTLEN